MAPVIIQFQMRKGTATEWTAANPVLLSGEPAYETDTGLQKTGDGTTEWNNLPYSGGGGGGEGDITGPETSTNGKFPLWVGTDGDELSDSVYGPSDFAPANFSSSASTTFEINSASPDGLFELSFTNAEYPTNRIGELNFFVGDDYCYQEFEVYGRAKPYVGYPDWGGNVSDLYVTMCATGNDLEAECASCDVDISLDGVKGDIDFDMYSYQESGSTVEARILLEAMTAEVTAYLTAGDVGGVTMGIKPGGTEGYMEIVGDTGSYLQLGDENVWLEGSYRPARNWGVLASAPSSGLAAGDMYYNSSTSKACYYTGSAWINLN